MYRLITADGKITEKQRMTLKQMQEFVGGYVEQWRNILCNEDGLRLKLPRNSIDPRFVGNIIEEFIIVPYNDIHKNRMEVNK